MKCVIEEPKAIARIVKNRREELKISQRQLAALCELSHNGISKLETNESEIRLTTLIKMSKHLRFKLIIEFEAVEQT